MHKQICPLPSLSPPPPALPHLQRRLLERQQRRGALRPVRHARHAMAGVQLHGRLRHALDGCHAALKQVGGREVAVVVHKHVRQQLRVGGEGGKGTEDGGAVGEGDVGGVERAEDDEGEEDTDLRLRERGGRGGERRRGRMPWIDVMRVTTVASRVTGDQQFSDGGERALLRSKVCFTVCSAVQCFETPGEHRLVTLRLSLKRVMSTAKMSTACWKMRALGDTHARTSA